MSNQDSCCTLVPYFKVHQGQLAAFREGCRKIVEKTRAESGCVFYGFSFDGERRRLNPITIAGLGDSQAGS